MIRKSFTLRVLVVSFLFLALPLLVNSFIFFQDSYNEAIQDAKDELKAEVDLRTSTLLSFQPVKQILLRELVYIMDLEKALENPIPNKMSRLLAETVHEGGEFRIFILKNETPAKYKIVASSDPIYLNTYFISYRRLETIIEQGEGSLIRYVYSDEEGELIPFLYLVRTITSPKNGQMIGAIMAVSNVKSQIDELIRGGSSQKKIQFAILNPDGIVFDSSDPKLEGNYFDPISKERREEIIASGQIPSSQLMNEPLPIVKKHDPPFFEFLFNGQVQIAYRSFNQISGVSFISYSNKEAFFSSAVRRFLLIYSIYGLILVVGSGITYWLSLWISRPLRQLNQKMEQVSHGNLNVRFQEEHLGFEINILGSMFNNMLDNLFQKMQRTEDETVKREKYQRELAITRTVQQSLLPRQFPVVNGTQFAGTYLPAQDVGGDFYDFLKKKIQDDEVILISVADAVGRGISACLYSFSIRSLLNTYAEIYDDVGKILTLCNDAFIEDVAESGTFVTLFYGMYNTASQSLNYCSCGHVPSFLKKRSGEVVTLNPSQIALGLKEGQVYNTENIKLMPGDLLLLYTDGLIEAENEMKVPFSKNSLREFLEKGSWNSAQELVDGLKQAVITHTQNQPQEEEIIIVALSIDQNHE